MGWRRAPAILTENGVYLQPDQAEAPVPRRHAPVTIGHRLTSPISFNINNLYNGALLALRSGMRTLGLLLALLCLPFPPVHGQEADAPEGAVIESAEVSGIDRDQLSPGLRQDIDALKGTPLDRARTGALAARIEEERPEVVTAVRAVARPNGDARVVFLVARISDDTDLAENINARYAVEGVEIAGVPESDVSQALRDRLQSLVGRPLDTQAADEMSDSLRAELPGHEVKRRIARGTARGQIRVVFEITTIEIPWIRFTPSRSKIVYHEVQHWSVVTDIPIGNRDHRFGLGLVWANNDDLIEEYSGFRLKVESRKLGTERLGASMEFSRFNQTWQDATLAALALDASIPEAYRTRLTVDPTVTFAFTPNVRVSGGASISDLESLSASPNSQMANAWVAGVGGDQQWLDSGNDHRVEGGYQLRAAAGALGSDLVYKRHTGQARYAYKRGRSAILAGLSLGYITGQAPLFERFTLGDSSTLRGWNKFDLAPAGGDRMWHQSLEYRYRAGAVFLDAGSVWNPGTANQARLSAGFGLHTDHLFLTAGFPLNADGKGVMFMAGVRF